MIKIENFEVVGWEHAIRGMRNPMNSWDRSDSGFKGVTEADVLEDGKIKKQLVYYDALGIGPNDHELMMKLANAGDDHGKAIRYIDVYVDITAPLYWWKEFRTYRKGRKFMDDGDDFLDPDALEPHIETNSCSTMHKIHEKEFTIEDFSCEQLLSLDCPGAGFDYNCPVRNPENKNELVNGECVLASMELLKLTVDVLNTYRYRFLKTKDKKYWWQMIKLLPSSYNQKRTVKLNYQVLKNMYRARKDHKLDEWREFCKWIEELPYSEIITGESNR